MSFYGYALAVLLMSGAAAGLFLDIPGNILVPVGATGISIMLAIEVSVWWRRGMAPGRMETIFGSIGLLCGVPAYYFSDSFAVYGAALAGFFLCIILVFAAQIWGQTRKTKRLYLRWKAARAEQREEENA